MILYVDIESNSQLIQKLPYFDFPLSVSSDSRSFKNENCFLSLYGPSFDSIDFIPDVIKKGARVILIEESSKNHEKLSLLENKYPAVIFIKVKNIFKFILELGNRCSQRFQNNGGKLIGLTGSNGKTTNKEMLRHLFSFLGAEKVHATSGNLNNQIGVPLTLFEIEGGHKVSIIEMGTNFPGEIKILSECADPSVALITNIGHAHLEFLKNLDGVFEEKTALFNHVEKKKSSNGIIIKNSFDDKIKNYKNNEIVLELNSNNFLFLEEGFEITLNEAKYTVENKYLLGNHQKLNMGLCVLLACSLFPESIEHIILKAKSYTHPNMNRGEILEKYSRRFYLDAYNANPDSMKASINSYISFLEKENVSVVDSLVILGDMNELGDMSKDLHEKIGISLREHGFLQAIFIGQYANAYQKGFGKNSLLFETVTDFKKSFAGLNLDMKEVFIKGSRSLQLESILDINW